MKTIIIFLIVHSSLFILNCLAQQTGWEIIPSGTTQDLNSILFYDYEVGFACGNSGTVDKSIDSGKTWQALGWQLIVDRLKELGQLDRYEEIIPVKDWTTSRDGGPRKRVREDLRL